MRKAGHLVLFIGIASVSLIGSLASRWFALDRAQQTDSRLIGCWEAESGERLVFVSDGNLLLLEKGYAPADRVSPWYVANGKLNVKQYGEEGESSLIQLDYKVENQKLMINDTFFYGATAYGRCTEK